MRAKYFSLIFLSLLFVLGDPSSAGAQNGQIAGSVFTVNDTGDSHDSLPGDGSCVDSGGHCTLRAAIEESNATVAGDAIIFSLPQPSMINLSLGALSITQNLEIVGPGARRLTVQRSTVTGTPNFRVFHFPAGQSRVKIHGISIRNGNDSAGGGVYVQEGNSVGFYDVVIAGNSATAGGGIANFGTVSLVRSLVNSNIATQQGGAITNSSPNANIGIFSSTLTDNMAAFGGALDNAGLARLVNDTISRNSSSSGSSSIFSNPLGTVKVMNTIIGRDLGQSGPALQGQFESYGNNIVTNAQGSTGFTNGVNNDQVSNNNVIDPMLGPLSDNGGQTDTMALLSGSPAIGNANPCVINNCSQFPGVVRAERDQRRYLRFLGGNSVDVGAFEQLSFVPVEDGDFTVGVIGGSPSRYAGSLVILTNARTMEQKFARIRIDGSIHFQHILGSDDYVMDVRAKRSGWLTPLVIPIEF